MIKTNHIKGSPSQGLLAATLGFFFGSAAISLFGPTAKILNEVMNLSPTMMGLLVSIPILSGSLLRIPFGAAVDENGGSKPFIWLMVLSVVGLAGLSVLLATCYPHNMDGTYWLILLLGCLSGCGVATFSVGAGQTSYWYPKSKQGFALGIFGGFGTLGAGVFAIALPILLQNLGFVNAYFAWTIFLILGTIIYVVLSCNAYYFQHLKKNGNKAESMNLAKQSGQELFPSGNMKESLAASAKVIETWMLVAVYFVSFGGFIALTAWLPTYWQNAHGFSLTKAGIFTASYACLAALLRIPGGKISDGIGGVKVSLFSMTLLGVSALFMSFSTNWALSGICTLFIAVAFGLNNAAIMKLVAVYVPKSVGGASGWVGGLGAFGGFLLPPIMGKVVHAMGELGYSRGFLLFVIMSVMSIGIIYFGLIVRNKNKS
ncbi:MAG: MFS transporter [Mangrovibacterium sp.]